MMSPKLFFIFVPLPFFAKAQGGKVFDNLTLKSKLLSSERKYAIYLPPDYETSTRNYPVMYLLHGAGDDQTGWVQFGEVAHIADKAIAAGAATPMIIVMPDANTGVRGYFNSIKNDFAYEDFFFTELIPFIEKTYRAKSEKRFRAIAGLSMGGGATIVYALHHPELFAAACPLSAGNGLQPLDSVKAMLKRSNPTMADSTIDAYAKRNNGIALVNSLSGKEAIAVRWYIDCGDDDPRSEANAQLHAAMNKKGIAHEFRIRNGGHTWTYWRAALPEVLQFVSESFHQF